MKRILGLSLVAALLMSGSWVRADLVGVEVGAGGVTYTAWGSVTYNGTKLDMRNTLGLTNQSQYLARVRVELPLILPNLYFEALPLSWEKTLTQNQNFVFGDRTFSANVPYTTSFKFNSYDAALFYGIPFLGTATNDIVRVNWGLNFRFLEMKADINQSDLGIHVEKKLNLVIPMGFLAARVRPVDSFAVEAEFRGIGYGTQRYLDAALRAKYFFLKCGFASVGYRYQDLQVDSSGVRSQIFFGGPSFELGVDF